MRVKNYDNKFVFGQFIISLWKSLLISRDVLEWSRKLQTSLSGSLCESLKIELSRIFYSAKFYP